ncbi:hypothetical protein LCI18_012125 [Fusarium solani-melongenae]|uniref:Uncharacterized protein n=1 Tax=Fusarium solani subsp. cucurbitae TaxID=2747967 RepID=A0ACD3ZJ17_FUSSC|nr:hypothetical protein LCI18_012125 [Fusarium solani-melongenae]
MKRLGYKKSRTGCQRCKSRRVKCNEAVPCSACVRHRLRCSLQYPDSQSAGNNSPGEESSASRHSASPPSSGAPTSKGPIAFETQPLNPTDTIPHFFKFLDHAQLRSQQDWASDLELLHHYTAVAYQTISFWGEVRQTLQYDVPREGMTHTFLLQQVLAFSGFHLAYLHPDRRHYFLVRAWVHQDQAVMGVNSVLADGLTSANCHALYASAIFLLICAFATYPSCEMHHPTFSPVDGLVDIFRLTDGISLLLTSSGQDLRQGPLRGLFAGKSAAIDQSDHLQCLADQLLALKQLLLEPRSDEDGADTSVVLEATVSLADSILSVHKNHSFAASLEVRAAFLWPLRMPSRYLSLTRQREPLALVVLAHYCVLLQYAEASCWFIKGWAAGVLTSITASLAGTSCEDLIRWPSSIVNSASSV